MDLVLCPVNMGAPDMLVASNFAWISKRMSLPVVFVGNNLSSGQRRRQELTEELKAMEVPVCPVLIQSRVAHLDAMNRGQSACEWAPDSPAARELNNLWQWIVEELGISVGETAEKNRVL
jgi:cellulose biosynthesis protein BcsQ